MTDDRRQKQTLLLIIAGLVLATLVAYEPIRHNDFVMYDDNTYIKENPHVTGGITYDSAIWAFTKSYASNWHPLTWLSHMLDCEIYGLDPMGHHIISVLLHIANSLLLFLALMKMTGATWKSAFVAGAFALHPLRVESVAWAAERKDVLSGLFWMLTILAYIHYAKQPNVRKYSLVLLTFVMGLMSKPMVVTLPFVLLLLDYWPLNRFPISNCRFSIFNWQSAIGNRQSLGLLYEKIPLFALSGVSSLITLVAQKQGEAVVSFEVWPFHTRIINALGCYFNYIAKTFYPKNLSVLYPATDGVSTTSAVLAVAGAAVLLFLGLRGRRWLVVGLLWYLGTLVPVAGLVQVGSQTMADRYTYLPSIGIFLIIAWGAEEIFSKLRYSKTILIPAAAASLIIMALLTRVQVGYWRDSGTLFKRATAVNKNNFVMLGYYGLYLSTQGRYEEGLQYLNETARICPECLVIRQAICATLLSQNKLDEAIACLNEALLERNDWPEIYKMYHNLGLAYERKGDFALSEINYRKAVTLNPDYAPARDGLKSVLTKQGNPAEKR